MVVSVVIVLVLFVALLMAYPWMILTAGTLAYLVSLPFGYLSYRGYQERAREAKRRRRHLRPRHRRLQHSRRPPRQPFIRSRTRAAPRALIEPHRCAATRSEVSMRIARRTLLTSMIASVAGPAVFGARASATSVGLKLHHFLSVLCWATIRFLVPWVRKVEAESAGSHPHRYFSVDAARWRSRTAVRPGARRLCRYRLGDAGQQRPDALPRIEAFEMPFSRLAAPGAGKFTGVQDYAAGNLQDEFRDVRPLLVFRAATVSVVSFRPRSAALGLGRSQRFAPARSKPLCRRDALRALGGQGDRSSPCRR